MIRACLRRAALCSFVLLGPLASCASPTTRIEPIQDLVLAVGDSVRVASATVRVIALQDSRCPGGVSCITAGDVVIVLAFSGAESARTDTLRLNAAPKTTTYGSLLFQPTAVLPYPDIRTPSAPLSLSLHVSLAPSL